MLQIYTEIGLYYVSVHVQIHIVTLGKVLLFFILPLIDINGTDRRVGIRQRRSIAPITHKTIIWLDEHLSKAVSI